MHTATLTQRFGVPALVAATFHVVLLFAINAPARPPVIDLPDERVMLRPFPKELLMPPLPETPPESSAPVKPLHPGPVRPVTEDRSVPKPSAVAMEPAIAPAVPRVPVTTVPERWGDGTADGKPTESAMQGRSIFTLGELDRVPRAKVQPAPDYPLPLRQAGTEGGALVEFDVDPSGRVVTARALQSTHAEFAAAAVRAVLRWRFEPGRRDGRAVPFRMVVPIGFSLSAG